jgi:preprotein translocase subunit SecF
LLKSSYKVSFPEIVNISLNETLVRSINTSLTVIITLLSIYIFGGASIKYFSLALLIGITFGTYSSIFIASGLLVTGYNITIKNK